VLEAVSTAAPYHDAIAQRGDVQRQCVTQTWSDAAKGQSCNVTLDDLAQEGEIRALWFQIQRLQILVEYLFGIYGDRYFGGAGDRNLTLPIWPYATVSPAPKAVNDAVFGRLGAHRG